MSKDLSSRYGCSLDCELAGCICLCCAFVCALARSFGVSHAVLGRYLRWLLTYAARTVFGRFFFLEVQDFVHVCGV